MEKMLITGATGFIGRYVIEKARQNGFEVIASSAHPQHARGQPWFGTVDYIPFDLGDWDPALDWFRLLGSPDRMLHLAWEGLPNYKNVFHLEVNLPRHAAFLHNLISHGLRHLTVTGTCLEYGMQEGCLTETQPVFPGNPYAQAKDRLRRQLEQWQAQYPFTLRWARLFYLYGKGQNPNSLFSQLDKALAGHELVFNMSGGEQVRDYLRVEAAADYLVRIAGQDRVGGIINCCSGFPVTVRKLIEDYLQRRGEHIALNLGYYPYPDYEPFRFWGDVSKLKTILAHE
ncbi:MAG TPA: NAD(P)-dependent oxidoreductase [Puia sp.]|nr:NAD(P)-dependent oxidoreductase [Puia sp.]